MASASFRWAISGSSGLLAAVQIVVDESGVIIVHCHRSVIESGEHICPDVPNVGWAFIHCMKDIFDMAAVQLEKTGLNNLMRYICTIDTDRRTLGTDRVQHDLNHLIHTGNVITRVLRENVNLKIFSDKLFVLVSHFHRIHPIKIDRWIIAQESI